MKPADQPNAYQLLKISEEALSDIRSVVLAYAKRPVKAMTWKRVERAAKRLGLAPPPVAT